MYPSSIHFSQDSIASEFSNGSTLLELFQQVITGEKSVDDIKRVQVFDHNKTYWIYSGNRRLFVFKELQKHGFIKSIPVKVVQSPFEREHSQVGKSSILTYLNELR
jgi:hypothetical protein